jgi:hypothetical protein
MSQCIYSVSGTRRMKTTRGVWLEWREHSPIENDGSGEDSAQHLQSPLESGEVGAHQIQPAQPSCRFLCNHHHVRARRQPLAAPYKFANESLDSVSSHCASNSLAHGDSQTTRVFRLLSRHDQNNKMLRMLRPTVLLDREKLASLPQPHRFGKRLIHTFTSR